MFVRHAVMLAALLLSGLAAARPMPDTSDASDTSDTSDGTLPGAAARQAPDEAWWTGPLLANSPATLPKGRGYVETYFYDVRSDDAQFLGSQSYLLYGVADRLTAGLRPSFGDARLPDGEGSRHVGAGDLTLHAQYALTRPSPRDRMPALAVAVQETLPTARYDRLARAGDGFGSGAHTTTVALYAQEYFWMPNGRLLRGRINVGASRSGWARVHGRSVYGTPDGFDGDAWPGAGTFAGVSAEYSATQHWGFAVDLTWRHDARTAVRDRVGGTTEHGRASDSFALAPAVEYNWSARIGVIAGARYIPAWGRASRSVTPIAAISLSL